MRYLQTLDNNFNEMLGLKGKPFIPSTVFTKCIDKEFSQLKRYLARLDINLSFIIDKKLRKQDIIVSGEYDFEVDKITVFINTCKGMNTVNYNRYKKIKTVSEIILTIMHELIHRKQFMHRGTLNDKHYIFARTGDKNVDEQYEYYSDTDEVPAFAHCVYTELKMNHPDLPIGKILKMKKKYSSVLDVYKAMYKSNSDTMVEFYKAIFRWERLYNEFNSRVQKTI